MKFLVLIHFLQILIVHILSIKNNIDILIKQTDDIIVVTTDKEFLGAIGKINISNIFNRDNDSGNIIYAREKMIIKKLQDEKSKINYVVLFATLDNNYNLYIRSISQNLNQ